MNKEQMGKMAERTTELLNKLIWGKPTTEEFEEYKTIFNQINEEFENKFGGNIKMI